MIEVNDGEFAIRHLLRFEEAIESRMIRGQSPRRIYETLRRQGRGVFFCCWWGVGGGG